MSSEDVIELGSSDDEPTPTPNKKKKPLPNAMVHIPNKLHGVTIRPASKQRNVLNKPVSPANFVAIQKNRPIVTMVPKNIGSGKPVLTVKKTNLLQNPVKKQKSAINPISLMKNLTNSQVIINKVPSNLMKYPIKVQGPKPCFKFSSNPPPSPGITIHKVCGNSKRPNNGEAVQFMKKKKKINNDTSTVLTILDDDDVSTSTSSPQWYLRPEQQIQQQEQLQIKQQEQKQRQENTQEQENLEESNNKEPEPQKFIEITIEDSPVKPTHKKTEHITEFTITIEDSPLKTSDNKIDSGREFQNKQRDKDPNSKKRLEYPNADENVVLKESIEIEIEPMDVDLLKDNVHKDNTQENNDKGAQVVEIYDSPVKTEQTSRLHILKKDNELNNSKNKDNEFSSVYQNFIDLCFQLENSEDMTKIVEKKIKAYYRQVPKEYTESEEFTDMVSSKIDAMKADPTKMYLYIKDIVDELNLRRKMTKSLSSSTTKTANEEQADTESFMCGKDGEFDAKRHRQIRKLEKTIKKLHRAIQKLEEQEVDFDDEEDSVYLLTERYKERMVRVHAKLCQLTCTKMPSEPRVHIEARPNRPAGPSKRLEKWVNKKVPIGTPLPFPDFHDVLRCVREANEEDKLGWNEADIIEEARDLFTRCGRKLQRRRQENEWRLAVSRLSADVDPAENSEELKKQLEKNQRVSAVRETEILNKYADRQNLLKLEPEEIGDKEADESPSESEDDEGNDEDSILENKFKRKQRLKRLIEEKSKINASTDKSEKYGNQKSNTNDEHKIPLTVSEANKDFENPKGDAMSIEANISNLGNKNHDKSHKNNDTNNVSDDSNKLSSDIDELHLLNKLYSENEMNTSQDSTGTVTPIAISDTLDSDSDTEKKEKPTCDIISIENSSFSEAETDVSHNKCGKSTNEIKEGIDIGQDVDVQITLGSVNSTNNEESNECVESVLLTSPNDEESNDVIIENNKEGVNLRDVDIRQDADVQITLDSINGTNNEESSECVESVLLTSPNNEKSNDVVIENKNSTESVNLRDLDIRQDVDGQISLNSINGTNNEESNDCVESVLLASPNNEDSNDMVTENSTESVNLRDDSISIGETVIEGVDEGKESSINDDSKNEKTDLTNENCVKSFICTQKNVLDNADAKDSGSTQPNTKNSNQDTIIVTESCVKNNDNESNAKSESNLLMGNKSSLNTDKLSEEIAKIESITSSDIERTTIETGRDLKVQEGKDNKMTSELSLGSDKSNKEIPEKESIVSSDIEKTVIESENDLKFKKDENHTMAPVESTANEEQNIDNQQDQTLEQLLQEMMGSDSNDSMEVTLK